MENLIEVRGLCKSYKDFSLKNIDLTLPKGMIVGLVGENGAGKTTTLKAILNVIRPDAGTIRLLGRPSGEPAARAAVGVVFEDSYFPQNLCPGQILKVMEHLSPAWSTPRFAGYCKRFGLPLDKQVKELSRGMRMKLSLSTALAQNPRVLVLDEATSGLDPVVRGEILDIFLEFIQDEEHGVLLASHITSDLERVADQVAYIHGGRLMFQKDKDALLEEMAVLHTGKAQLASLPGDWVLGQKRNAFGCDALVLHPEKIRTLLPDAVLDKACIDEIMQFYTGREEA